MLGKLGKSAAAHIILRIIIHNMGIDARYLHYWLAVCHVHVHTCQVSCIPPSPQTPAF